MSETMGEWYVVEAYPGKDAALARRLHAVAGIEAFRPLIEEGRSIRRARNGRPMHRKDPARVTVLAPRFPPFVLARADADGLQRLRAILRGWKDFGYDFAKGLLSLAGTDEPATVPDAIVFDYRTGRRRAPGAWNAVAVGELVEWIEGPYAGMRGVVAIANPGGTIGVEMAMMGRMVIVFGEQWRMERIASRRALHDRAAAVGRADIKQPMAIHRGA